MLTREQYAFLGRKVFDKPADIEVIARNAFQHEWSPEDSDELEKVSSLFRCEKCRVWTDVEDRSDSNPGVCRSCV